jgi:two-component system cell cycle response regulator
MLRRRKPVPQKVLIIDDSSSIHALLKVRLRDEPVEMVSAADGPAGVEAAKRIVPDLILLDVDMPGTDGFTVCRQLKSDPITAGIPVVFLTAASSTEEKIKGLDLGAVDYITKPFDVAELRARVRAGLRTKFLLDLLAQKAMIDGLTGLWNRAYFDQRLAGEISLSQRSGHPLSVIMGDVDHFKQINDRFGHPGGDEVLRTIAQLLTDVPNSDGASATELALRFNRLIGSHEFICRGVRTTVTCSFGVANLPSHPPRDVIQLADEALYRAKQLGRNRVEVGDASAVTLAA